MTDLLHVNVWLPLGAPDHVHHARARAYWEHEASDQLGFCRVTALAYLRLLTDSSVMGEAVLAGQDAWRSLETWVATDRVVSLPEPTGVDAALGRMALHRDLRGGSWTDAYLAAFATAGGFRLVTFDGGFNRFGGLSWLRLEV